MTNLSHIIDEMEVIAKSRASMGFKLFRPYDIQLRFVAETADHDNLCLSGANRTGKTALVGRYALPIWATGQYPEDWKGRRWDRAITAWVGSTDWTTNIDGCQRALLGDVHKGKDHAGIAYWDDKQGKFIPPGIPAESISKIEYNPHVKGTVSRCYIKHEAGGQSEIRFVSFLQGRERLQAGKADIVWADEEPPEDVMTELSARTIDSAGLSLLTFTPLKGISSVVRSFIGDAVIDVKMPNVLYSSVGVLVRMSAFDVPHLADHPEIIAAMERKYPRHQHMARIQGIPALGEGAIYPFDDAFLTVQPFDVPEHWHVLDGIDLGFSHPTARARLVMNPDTQEIFLTRTYKQSGQSPRLHVEAWETQFPLAVPVAWPHDGRNSETDGKTKISRYKELGMQALNKPVAMPGSKRGMVMPLEGSIQLLYEWMEAGKFKVFAGNHHFFSEKALYRREKVKTRQGGVDQQSDYAISSVVKEMDDVMDAVRYAFCEILRNSGVPIRYAKERSKPKVVYGHTNDNSDDSNFNPFDYF